MAIQAKQALPEGNRRVRTSAAMIGLAVSVGAYGLPIPHQGDQAIAAEPTPVDPTTSNVPPSFETAAVLSTEDVDSASTSPQSASSPIRHTVQEGQTLWDVARFYGTDASILASANGLSLNSVLRVGQVLTVPVDTRVAQATTASSSSMMPGYYGPVSNWKTSSQVVATAPQVDAALKTSQDEAVETLKQKQDTLRSGLAQLTANASQVSKAVEQPTIANAQVPLTSPALGVTASEPAPSANSPTPVEDGQAVAFRSPNQFSGSNTQSLSTVTHRVAPGDTLSTIARAHGVTVKQMLEVNRIGDPNYIFVGQTLIIPGQPAASLTTGKFESAIAAVPSKAVADVPVVRISQTAELSPSAGTSNSKVAAVVPFTAAPQPTEATDSSSRMLQYNHVESLKLEIDRLREKHQAQTGRLGMKAPTEAQVAVVPARPAGSPAAVTEPVNPEFNPDRYATRLREIRDRIRPASTTQATPGTTVVRTQNAQLVAAAPLGSESYDPIKSRLGRTVSPELPSLGTGSEFLPSAPGQMNGMIWPTKGVLTSGYGWRWGRMHKGIDIAGPIGTPIVAAAEGRITYAGWNSGGYGYLVEIQHPDGSLTLYAHNNRILVQVGQEVDQGQQIAEMGSTGYSTGPHLHFEVHPTGRGAVNPMPFLQARG
ncbi:MAG: peptidoglycan DD-metalloendopeptidase family protein [Leptolyngbyaceae cyanobacterium bins.349]|nr:peptidoglycan DD-metalloendopeptidase family protein [Leptolyngbyaceae cyanobacterium bins.349]